MAINTIQSTNPLDQLAQTLVSRYDANKDGQLSTEEFASFVTQFLGSATTTTKGLALGVNAGAPANGLKAGSARPELAGFNDRKLADVNHTTLKYTFGRVAQQYSLESVRDKASGEALLNTMRPDLEAAGMTVLAVQGDKIQIKDEAGQEAWIDVIRNCSSGRECAWQWNDLRF